MVANMALEWTRANSSELEVSLSNRTVLDRLVLWTRNQYVCQASQDESIQITALLYSPGASCYGGCYGELYSVLCPLLNNSDLRTIQALKNTYRVITTSYGCILRSLRCPPGLTDAVDFAENLTDSQLHGAAWGWALLVLLSNAPHAD